MNNYKEKKEELLSFKEELLRIVGTNNKQTINDKGIPVFTPPKDSDNQDNIISKDDYDIDINEYGEIIRTPKKR